FLVAARRALGAAVTFYGGGIVTAGRMPFPALFDEAKSLKTPWLGIFGDRDAGLPGEDGEKLRAELDRTNPGPDQIRRYVSDHGFHCAHRPAVDDETAGKDAWRRALDWCDRHL